LAKPEHPPTRKPLHPISIHASHAASFTPHLNHLLTSAIALPPEADSIPTSTVPKLPTLQSTFTCRRGPCRALSGTHRISAGTQGEPGWPALFGVSCCAGNARAALSSPIDAGAPVDPPLAGQPSATSWPTLRSPSHNLRFLPLAERPSSASRRTRVSRVSRVSVSRVECCCNPTPRG
jgi:hypothetical protein